MDIKTALTNFSRTHLTSQHGLEWDDLFACVKFVMRENKAKNSSEVGEFNKFLWQHGLLDHFLTILGVAIKEEKIFMYFTVCSKVLPCRSYKICMQSV